MMGRKLIASYLVKDLPTVDPRTFKFKTTWKDNEFIGVEFEMEGINLPSDEDIRYHWNYKSDGSLRAPDEPGGGAAEYVSKKPVSPEYFKEKCFPHLIKSINKKRSDIRMSVRCSTHVHVGVHQLYLYQAFMMAGLYYIFEDLFYNVIGEDRKGNLFVASPANSEVLAKAITNAISKDQYHVLLSKFKYTAVNFGALTRFGTLEFRALEGTLDKDRIYLWIDILVALRTFCATLTPSDCQCILSNMSAEGPIEMFARILGGKHRITYKTIMSYFNYNEEVVRTLIYDGISRIQSMFYETEWETINPVTKLKDEDIPERLSRKRKTVEPFAQYIAAHGSTPSPIPSWIIEDD